MSIVPEQYWRFFVRVQLRDDFASGRMKRTPVNKNYLPVTSGLWVAVGLLSGVAGCRADGRTQGTAPGATASAVSTQPASKAPWVNPVYGPWHAATIGGGGYMQNVVLSPTDPKRLYAYGDMCGVYRSDTGGKDWRLIQNNLPGTAGNHGYAGMLVDPRNADKVILATGDQWAQEGIYRSEDGGKTWTKTLSAQWLGNGPLRGSGFLLARDPQHPDILLAASVGTGAFRSEDNGATWAPSGAEGIYSTDVRFDRANPSRAWLCSRPQAKTNVGKYKGLTGGFFRSEDGGKSWTLVAEDSPSEILQDPADAGTIYGIFGGKTVQVSKDGGTSWTPLADGLPTGKDAGISSLAAGPNFLLTANTAAHGNFYKLNLGETTWQPVERKGFDNSEFPIGDIVQATASITVDPANPDHWYATDFMGIYQTWDGGKTAKATSKGLELTVVHDIVPDPTNPAIVHLGMADVGGFVSEDGGASYQIIRIPQGGTNIKNIAISPKDPSIVYEVGSNGYGDWSSNQLFVSKDGGHHFDRRPMVGTGLPGGWIACDSVAVDPNDPQTVYITNGHPIKENDGGVYKSTDGGRSWTWMSQGMPVGSWYFRANIWTHGPELAASSDGSLVAISAGRADRFDPATKTWTGANLHYRGMLYSVVADPLTPGRYFVGAQEDGVYRSDDSGTSWKRVFGQSVQCIGVDPRVPGRVAAGTKDGVALSTDGGATWAMMDGTLPHRIYNRVGFAGNRLLVGTGGNGMFWYDLGGAPVLPTVVVAAPVVVAPAAAAPAKIADAAKPKVQDAALTAPAAPVAAPALSTAPAVPANPAPTTVGESRVASWKGGKTACFLLMFDDGWPSGWQVAAPELLKRGLTATFYIVPKKGEYSHFESKWKTEVIDKGLVLGNHTMTHDGVSDLADGEWELGDCTKYIWNAQGTKQPRLVSFAQPGGVPWKITPDQFKELLAKNHLIDRPTFAGHGAVYHMQKTEQMLALADKAIASHGMEYLVIHGVERITPNWGFQDFWALKQDIFLPLLDGLQARRDRGDLWITDHISEHQYATERGTAKVTTLDSSAKKITLQLQCDADPQFYDLALTLTTKVPGAWKLCQVAQGANKTVVPVKDGLVQYDAVPGPDTVMLQPAP